MLWPCVMNVGWRERNQQDATNRMLIIKLLSQHVSGIIMPIVRRTRPCITAYGVLYSIAHSQHNQCRTPYAVIHGLVLLMMGIMMPETCWDRSLIINIWLVASCWFFSLHPNVWHVSNLQMFILRKVCTCAFRVISFMHPYKQSDSWQDVSDTIETCRRHYN